MTIELLLGFLTGLLCTWLSWKYMLFVKPKVAVAPVVCREVVDGKATYFFKVANEGKHQAIDLKFKASVYKLRDIPGGKIAAMCANLPFNVTGAPALSKRKEEWDYWELPPIYVFMSSPDFDLEALLNDPEARILFTVSVKDAMSGTSVVQRQSYALEDIVDGQFVKGLGFAVAKA